MSKYLNSKGFKEAVAIYKVAETYITGVPGGLIGYACAIKKEKMNKELSETNEKKMEES